MATAVYNCRESQLKLRHSCPYCNVAWQSSVAVAEDRNQLGIGRSFVVRFV